MLPSLVARDVQQGLEDYLTLGFEPSNACFSGIVREFVAEPGNLLKGPYLSLGLPFRPGTAGRDCFATLKTKDPPYVHQECAWSRLRTEGAARSTLVATGTGSGKTECFLYPVLDHCVREHAGGRVAGIKALIIYPMNALANDQARRFAEAVHRAPGLLGRIRIGLFVGEGEGHAAGATEMEAESVITSKEAMRRDPPDVLLTNYKMLDYLLIRPRDRDLWRCNGPETLRYLVVDELHTFDGAQGTDLALLIRRLKARLDIPRGHLVCVGTSATLGAPSDAQTLIDYAQEVFDTSFDEEAIIGESRLLMAEFIGGKLIEHQLFPDPALGERLDPARYASMAEAIAAWHAVFFPDEPEARLHDPAWRAELGAKLKQQFQFNNLLRALERQPRPLVNVAHDLARSLPPGAREHVSRIVDALCAVVAWARDPERPGQPFVQLRLQLWVRELRRMVAPVRRAQEERRLVSADDLKGGRKGIYLPLVQCWECHATGFLGRLPAGEQRVDTDLRAIYNAFFKHEGDAALFYPEMSAASVYAVRGTDGRLCAGCGHWQGRGEVCEACGADELVAAFRPQSLRQVQRGQTTRIVSDPICPACGAEEGLILFGARATSLSAVAIQHAWATPFNDDKKLIAFSDSVQDAAHRAGFFAARTWASNVRMAIAQALAAQPEPRISWSQFVEDLPAFWLDPGRNPAALSQERFVAEFIGPNMLWLEDYEAFLQSGQLKRDGWLLDAVKKRLRWEVLAEFGYLCRRGRSLERVACAAAGVRPGPVQAAVREAMPELVQGLGLRDLTAKELSTFVWGLLLHLKQRGAIGDQMLETYIDEGGRSFLLGRLPFLPGFGPESARPVFLSLAPRHAEFETVLSNHRTTWYRHWLRRTLGRARLLPDNIEPDLYRAVIGALVKQGVLFCKDTRRGPVVGLEPEALFLSVAVARLATAGNASELVVPRELGSHLSGLPSLDVLQEETYAPAAIMPHWLSKLYRSGDLRRVIAAEHTGLLEREDREALEARFKAAEPLPWHENLLSATPTLEMGVDIGDLSAVLLCSVPPAQASYLQRIGRAGRRDGNALALLIAAGNPHDLYFYAQPEEMMAGRVHPPGVFLNASAVLFRQLTAYCMDRWVATGIDASVIPVSLRPVLDAVERYDQRHFPYNFERYVQEHTEPLLRGFLALLEHNLTEPTAAAVRQFMYGTHTEDGLRVRLIKRLASLVEERKLLRLRADALKREIERLKRNPQDEAVQARIEEADRERQGLLAIMVKINSRDTLGFLVDEGLLPNYAFPEAGVLLRSIIWRKRVNAQPGERPIDSAVLEYERPAAAALAELAPESRFYAGGRQVQIAQIDLRLSALERWRLCPSCSHAENIEAGDRHAVCTRCGDAHWADVDQVRTMVRLRQVIANTEDRRSRIGDDADDREPTFYTRQLLADFAREDVELAYRLTSDAVPFGFEFIRRVAFREINFGEYGRQAAPSFVAGKEASRPGFRICRHCGAVQRPARRAGIGESVRPHDHARNCPARDDDEAAIIDCLYLYREFQSEGVRILLPMTRVGADEAGLQSFIAALQLGLKLRFRGQVDHLRMTVHEEPGQSGGTTRRYLLLYDSVPGGTGYLHDLLRDANTLLDVFRLARDHLAACSCNHDPERDGCYQCLYAYRNSYGMEQTSRTVAVTLLTEILEAADRLERVPTISGIQINPTIGSELEARFIEALRRLGARDGLVQVQQEVVRGQPGYFLSVGEHEYLIAPQVELGQSEGVTVASRPDFVIWPARSGSAFRPVAIFLDGFEAHKDRVTDDTLKRLALVQSGRFFIWTITWYDISAAYSPGQDVLRQLHEDGQHAAMAALGTQAAAQLNAIEAIRYLRESPMLQLLSWLRDPNEAAWRGAVFARILGWFNPALSRNPETKAGLKTWFDTQAPSVLVELSRGEDEMFVGGIGWHSSPSPVQARCLLPENALQAPLDPERLLTILVLNRAECADDAAFKLAWRRFVAAINLLQFLPCSAWMAPDGIERGIYEQAGWDWALDRVGHAAAAKASAGLWRDLLADLASGLQESARRLAELGVRPALVGYELQDEHGAIIAEAELAWPAPRVCLLRPDQAAFTEQFEAAGWTAFVAEGDWFEHLIAALGQGEPP